MRLRVITFNVRGSFHDDGVNDWLNRRALNIETIRRCAPDVMGIQEAQQGNLEAYTAELGDYAVELGLVSIRQAENYHRVPIYWKHDRFEKLDGGGFYLSETPDEWSLGWGSTYARAATWVLLRERASGASVAVLNTHFPHERDSARARTESARLIVRQLDAHCPVSVPRIVMADFNASPDSEAHQVFIAAGYMDAYAASTDSSEIGTFHDYQGAAYPNAARIDWILAKPDADGVTFADYEVILDGEPPVYPSDHYPVAATLEFD